MRILVLKGYSRYDVLRIAADNIVKGFELQGCNIRVLDLTLDSDMAHLQELDWNDYDIVYSFQALLFNCADSENVAMYARQKSIKFIGHIVDHPIYHHERLNTIHGDNMYICVMDKNHIDFIHKYYKGVKNVYFLPHGGFPVQKNVAYLDRSTDVFFPSSYSSPLDVLQKIEELPDILKKIAEKMIYTMLENPMITLDGALNDYLTSIDFQREASVQFHLLLGLIEVDNYIRTLLRHNLVYDLLASGINVTVCGNGWDKFECEYKSGLTVVGENGLPLEQIVELMGNSKIVINQAPTLQNGTHERIFTSMRAGAICATIDFPIITEEFIDGENILLYRQNDVQSFSDRIKEILDNPELGSSIAQQGQFIAERDHKWEDNVERIFQIAKVEKL